MKMPDRRRNPYVLALVLAASLFGWAAWHFLADTATDAGTPLTLGFLMLALGFGGFPALKGFRFPVIIFAGVTLALYHPSWFTTIGNYRLTGLIIPLIQLIMFGMGTAMSLSDFLGVLREPKGVLVGLTAQLTLMPLVGYVLAHTSGLPPVIAAGIVLVGCSPSGVASNVMAYLARANLALSVTITALATLLAPLVTPMGMRLLAGELVTVDVLTMMWDIVKMILLPIGAGLWANRLLGSKLQRVNQFLPWLSMAAIALIIIIITAAGRESLLQMGGTLILVVLAHNFSGYLLGYGYARLWRMTPRDARTIALEVGMQNSGLASGIAYSMGKIATMGLAPAVFGPLMNISGSILAGYWHKRPLSREHPEA
ncbi:bile acid:sodium symporter family protein [Robiginitalea sp. M366]|uniref:bile acid:sodium symporter family protein n=1 Tax=Robiginitalea aestuariiviva TaxID=3036903 RepID=UPI00240D7F79|nr:bile acid:sodium symporter family protein [Robiginitalea aestuariiviva]MDG1571918.1 bile acid:sodium symporter family protein [Robiginitalea aestuariiviva]